MHRTLDGVAQKQNACQSVHEEVVLDGVALFLAALGVRLFTWVLGARDWSFTPIVKKGEAASALVVCHKGFDVYCLPLSTWRFARRQYTSKPLWQTTSADAASPFFTMGVNDQSRAPKTQVNRRTPRAARKSATPSR